MTCPQAENALNQRKDSRQCRFGLDPAIRENIFSAENRQYDDTSEHDRQLAPRNDRAHRHRRCRSPEPASDPTGDNGEDIKIENAEETAAKDDGQPATPACQVRSDTHIDHGRGDPGCAADRSQRQNQVSRPFGDDALDGQTRFQPDRNQRRGL